MAWRRKNCRPRRRPLRRRFARRARGRRVSRVSPVSVKRIIRSEIARNVETKTVQLDPAVRSLYYVSNAGWPTNNVIPLAFSPGGLQVLQGVGNGQRIGNRIKVKKLMFNFVMRHRTYDAGNNPNPVPLMVRMVLFYERDAPTDAPNPTTDFFDLNNSTSSIQGDLTDQIATFNTDTYRILAVKSFKLGPAEVVQGPLATTPPSHPNNDYKLNIVQRWNVTKYIPKLVRFLDTSAAAQSRGLWCCIMFSPSDGAPGSSGSIPVGMQYWLQADYEDA